MGSCGAETGMHRHLHSVRAGMDLRHASLAALTLLVAACADPSRPTDSSAASPAEPARSAAPAAVEAPPAPAELAVLGEAGRGSPIVAAQLSSPRPSMADPHGRVLLVADEEGD